MIRQLASDLRQRSLESPHISMQYTCNWAIDRYSRGKVPPVNENNCSGVYFSLYQLQFFERDCTFAEVLRTSQKRALMIVLFSLRRNCPTQEFFQSEHFSTRTCRLFPTVYKNTCAYICLLLLIYFILNNEYLFLLNIYSLNKKDIDISVIDKYGKFDSFLADEINEK